MDLLWFIKKKEEKTIPLPDLHDLSNKSMEELINKYGFEEWVLKGKANNHPGGLIEKDYEDIERIEKEIIERIQDEFKRNVFYIFARHRFNIVELLKDNSWEEDMKSVCKNICFFLRYGSPYPIKPRNRKPLPFSGAEYFEWLLSKAGDDPKDRVGNILNAAKEDFLQRKMFGHDCTDEEIQSIGGRLLTIFFSRESGRQVSVMIEIWLTIEGGKEFMKNLLKNSEDEIEKMP